MTLTHEPKGRRAHLLGSLGLATLIVALTGAGTVAGSPEPWAEPLARLDRALAERSYRAALAAAQDAYEAGMTSGRWEGLVLAGHAHRRLGDATELRRSFDTKARHIYLAALSRARAERSLPGVLQVADAFLALGDTEVAAQCVRVAERLAGQDRTAQELVRVTAGRLAGGAPQ
jgi:hypothetical protein